MSPLAAAGSLFRRPLQALTAMTKRFLAPVLSAQLTTAPTGQAVEILNLLPAKPPAKEKSVKLIVYNFHKMYQSERKFLQRSP